jgi:putative F0F1-ATPase subunit (Ca2+/Mg2+ transporter)
VNLLGKVVGLTRNGAAATPPGVADGRFRSTEQGLDYRGYEDGMARAFELALTPAIFCGIGYGIDRWLGTLPVFSIILFLVSVAGMFVRTWYAYDARMREEDAAAPWSRTPAAPAPRVEAP